MSALQQGNQEVATVQEAGQIRKQLDQLRQKRVEQILSLGNRVHKDMRQGAIRDPLYLQIAEPIGQLDREIYELAQALELFQHAQTNHHSCPTCKAPISEEDKFCGSCGESLPEQEPVELTAITCTHCEMMIPEVSVFCPCCGFSLKE